MYNKITNYNMTRNKYWEQRKTYYDEPIYKPRGFVDHPILSELRYDTSPVYADNPVSSSCEHIYKPNTFVDNLMSHELRYDTSPVYVDNPVSSSCEHIYKPNTFVDNLMSHELRYDTSPVYVENNKRRHFEPIYTMRGGGSDLDQTIINQYIQHKKNNKKDYEQLYRILAQKVNVEKHPERKQDTKMSKATNDILHVSQQALTHISKSKEETKASDDILRLAQQALSHAPVSSQEAHAQTKEETNATNDILHLSQQALTYVPVSNQEAHAQTKEETNATNDILRLAQQALTYVPVSNQEAHAQTKEETNATDDILRLAQQALTYVPVSNQEANATDDILRLAQQALTHVPTKEETKATDVITSQQETTSASVASVASAPAEENTTSPPQKNDVLTQEHIKTLKDNLLINKNFLTRKFGIIMSNWLPYLNFMKEKLKGNNINLPAPMDSELKDFFTAHENLKKNYIKVKGVFDTKTLSDNDKNQIKEELNQLIEKLKNRRNLDKSSKNNPLGTPM